VWPRVPAPARAAKTPGIPACDVVPFWGEHQGGIATPQQRYTYIAAFDLRAKQRTQVEQLLRDWTAASARDGRRDGAAAGRRSAHSLRTARIGSGWRAQRPAALIDLPL
jgi:deferrochelatase/peroxidase EfeB